MMKLFKKFANRSRVQRGFTLLVAVILSSVILSVGLALLDISLKQVTLAASSRQSQYAFYNADSALECALYWDSIDTFDYTSEPVGVAPAASGTFTCQGQTVSYYGGIAANNARTTTFSIPCSGDTKPGDDSSDVTVVKQNTGSTHFYANGYNTCIASKGDRVERGEEASY